MVDPRAAFRFLVERLSGLPCLAMDAPGSVVSDTLRGVIYEAVTGPVREFGMRPESTWVEQEPTPETIDTFPTPPPAIREVIRTFKALPLRLRCDHADEGQAFLILSRLDTLLATDTTAEALRVSGLGLLGTGGVNSIATKWGPRKVSSAYLDASLTWGEIVENPIDQYAIDFVGVSS